jgi:tetratricopeptide (TPR) repeat protein
VLREEVPTTVSKPVISWFAKEELKKLSLDSALEIGLYAIESINAHRHIAFEEEDAAIKREVAEIHAAKKDYDKAAKILEKINLENAHRNVDADEKVQVYVKIAEYWFEDDGDAVNAEKYINKAAHIMHHVKDQAF